MYNIQYMMLVEYRWMSYLVLFAIYYLKMRRFTTEKVWICFIADFGQEDLIQQFFIVTPFYAGDSNIFFNYQHFLSSLQIRGGNLLDVSIKLKMIFIIEVTSLSIYLYICLSGVALSLFIYDKTQLM